MERRPSNLKIPDIKALRSITRLLGTLGIGSCVQCWPEFTPTFNSVGNITGSTWTMNKRPGWGLKETKDYVEGKYEYYFIPEPYNPLREIQKGNIISEIKSVRRLTKVLNSLDIKSADNGLKVCKEYVERLRARR